MRNHFEIIFLLFNPHCLTSMSHKWNTILTDTNYSTSLHYCHRDEILMTKLEARISRRYKFRVIELYPWIKWTSHCIFFIFSNQIPMKPFTNLLAFQPYKPVDRRYSILRSINILQIFWTKVYHPPFYKPHKLYKP